MTLEPFGYRDELMRRYRDSIGRPVEYTCEVGVWRGFFSQRILYIFQSNLKVHYLVDLWAAQDSYADDCNTTPEKFEEAISATQKIVDDMGLSEKVRFLRGLSTEECDSIEDSSLDFCYIDARHDYLGCKDDIQAYWPKLKPGGLLAGHDYMTADDCKKLLVKLNHFIPHQDWSRCYDGSINPSAVKGAVDEFVEANNLDLVIGTEENWPTWAVLKPD